MTEPTFNEVSGKKLLALLKNRQETCTLNKMVQVTFRTSEDASAFAILLAADAHCVPLSAEQREDWLEDLRKKREDDPAS